jgi:prepilin-type N-terminal cleavage/methylation domain-containing protein
MRTIHRAGKAGFTLTEILVASSIATIVVAGVMSTFIWCVQQATTASKVAWSQNESMNTAAKLTMYIRNARKIKAIDVSQGTWVELEFAGGVTGRLVYSNAVANLRAGQMLIQRTNGTETIVARGLTEIQDSGGFTTPVFTKTRSNALRVAYRVSEPAATGVRAANDGPYAASTRFAVCLRNVEQ